MLRTGEALEELVQALQALLIVSITVFLASTLLERLLEDLPMQGPVTRIDAISVGCDNVLDLRPIEQVVDFYLQTSVSNFLASRSPRFGGDSRGLRMLRRRREFPIKRSR